MSKMSSLLFGMVNRRCYGVYARAPVNSQASAARKDGAAAVVDGVRVAVSTATMKKEVFWMRDPKTGCWAPENGLGEEVMEDAVELRNRLLNYK